jgi:predicted CXXCH cytochrome family protein
MIHPAAHLLRLALRLRGGCLHHRRARIAAAATGLVALLLAVACANLDRSVVVPLHIAGATYVGSAACADCHAEESRWYVSSPHGRRDRGGVDWAPVTGCESCHGPGSRHVATSAPEWIINPRREPEACLQCHIHTAAEFRLPSHHPLVEGRIDCVSCHDPHGTEILQPAGGLAMARENAAFGACHQDQHRPFVFEHEALREGCTVCHAPHGSIHGRLLTAPGNQLCLKCHAQNQTATGQIIIGRVDHTASLRLGGCYTAGCHMAVHGSNLQPKLRY